MVLSSLKTLPLLLILMFFSFGKQNFRTFSFRSEDKPVGKVSIRIIKSQYELQVFDELGWYATYPCVFGNKDQGDKLMEGDRKTPDGSFKILSKRPHEKWHKMLVLDYPNQDSWKKFKDRKAAGLIPSNARIGGGIAIHGTWPNDDLVVDDFTNWTQGCISMRNRDIDEIEPYLMIGTKVEIIR